MCVKKKTVVLMSTGLNFLAKFGPRSRVNIFRTPVGVTVTARIQTETDTDRQTERERETSVVE